MTNERESTREFRCPRCGYDGARMGKPTYTGFSDVNMMLGCPACYAKFGAVVWLEETTDPRSAA